MKCPQCYSSVAEENRYCHKCGFPLEEEQKTLTYTPPMEGLIDDKLHFFPGDSFGTRYRIVEEIGRGGMGRVYKAEDKELENAISLEKDSAGLRRSMANLHHILGNFEEAESILKQLIEKDDPYSQLRSQRWLGYLYLTQGKYEKCKNEVLEGINNSTTYNLKPIKLEFLFS